MATGFDARAFVSGQPDSRIAVDKPAPASVPTGLARRRPIDMTDQGQVWAIHDPLAGDPGAVVGSTVLPRGGPRPGERVSAPASGVPPIEAIEPDRATRPTAGAAANEPSAATQSAPRRRAEAASAQEMNARFHRAVTNGVAIGPDERFALVDTSETLPRRALEDLSRQRYVRELVGGLEHSFGLIQDELGRDVPIYHDLKLIGLSADQEYYGAHFRPAADANHVVAINPYAVAEWINNRVRNGEITAAEAPAEAARLFVRVLVHEATHQEIRTHGPAFDAALRRNVERTRRVLELARTRLTRLLEGGPQDGTVRLLEQLINDAAQIERGGARRAGDPGRSPAESTEPQPRQVGAPRSVPGRPRRP